MLTVASFELLYRSRSAISDTFKSVCVSSSFAFSIRQAMMYSVNVTPTFLFKQTAEVE